MDKLLVEVFVPAINKSFDMFIPHHIKMNELEKLLIKMIEELSEGAFSGSIETNLCNRTTGQHYDINKKVYELDIQNGSILMLI